MACNPAVVLAAFALCILESPVFYAELDALVHIEYLIITMHSLLVDVVGLE